MFLGTGHSLVTKRYKHCIAEACVGLELLGAQCNIGDLMCALLLKRLRVGNGVELIQATCHSQRQSFAKSGLAVNCDSGCGCLTNRERVRLTRGGALCNPGAQDRMKTRSNISPARGDGLMWPAE